MYNCRGKNRCTLRRDGALVKPEGLREMREQRSILADALVCITMSTRDGYPNHSNAVPQGAFLSLTGRVPGVAWGRGSKGLLISKI